MSFEDNDDIEFMIGYPQLEVVLNPLDIDIPDCGITYEFVNQDGT